MLWPDIYMQGGGIASTYVLIVNQSFAIKDLIRDQHPDVLQLKHYLNVSVTQK